MAFTLKDILKKAKQKTGVDPTSFIRGKLKDARSGKGRGNKPEIGSMYFYGYNPKHKKTLPFYDMAPLVVVIDVFKDGFLALNFHYLSPKLRVILLLQLLQISKSKKIKENMKLSASYQMLKRASGFKLYKPTVKRYLFDHLMSPLQLIRPPEWENAILVPSSKFKKASEAEVYKWSLSQM